MQGRTAPWASHFEELLKEEWRELARRMARWPVVQRLLAGGAPSAAACGRPGRPRRSRRSSTRRGVGAGTGEARGQRLARAPGLPVGALLRRARRGQAVAPGGARRDDPDHVGRLGRGAGGDRRSASASSAAIWSSLTSPHGKIELPAYPSEIASTRRGRRGPRAGPHVRGRVRPRRARQGHRAEHGRQPDGAARAAAEAGSGASAVSRVKVAVAKTGGRRPLAIPQATHDQDDRELAQHVALGAGA